MRRSTTRIRLQHRWRALGVLSLALLAGCGGSTSAGDQQRSSTEVGSATTPSSTSTRAGRPAAPSSPNIVFVLADDLSEDLVRYMPQVQALRRDGLAFTHYTVTDSLCCPSRASILTGRYPHNTGVLTNKPPDGGWGVFKDRAHERSTFATALQARGYRTAMMGKYLNGYQPTATVDGHLNYVPPGWNEWDVAGNGYPEFNYDLNENGRIVHYGASEGSYLTDVLSGKGADFIHASAGADKPFMLQIATFAPHGPYTPAPRDANRFPGLKAPRVPSFNRAATVGNPRWLRPFGPLSERQIREIDLAFRKRAQAVQAVDRMIGRLKDTLRREGVAENTYFVFSSDNGYHMGQHRLMPGKKTAFDSDIKVPLVITGPGVSSGSTTDRQAQNIDLFPTFAALSGAGIPTRVDGRSLIGLLHGRDVGRWRTASLIEHHGPNTARTDPDFAPDPSGNPPSYAAIRLQHSVYVEYVDGQREYYRIDKDPFQLRNVVSSLSRRERDHLHATLERLKNCHGGPDCHIADSAPPM